MNKKTRAVLDLRAARSRPRQAEYYIIFPCQKSIVNFNNFCTKSIIPFCAIYYFHFFAIGIIIINVRSKEVNKKKKKEKVLDKPFAA